MYDGVDVRAHHSQKIFHFCVNDANICDVGYVMYWSIECVKIKKKKKLFQNWAPNQQTKLADFE